MPSLDASAYIAVAAMTLEVARGSEDTAEQSIFQNCYWKSAVSVLDAENLNQKSVAYCDCNLSRTQTEEFNQRAGNYCHAWQDFIRETKFSENS